MTAVFRRLKQAAIAKQPGDGVRKGYVCPVEKLAPLKQVSNPQRQLISLGTEAASPVYSATAYSTRLAELL